MQRQVHLFVTRFSYTQTENFFTNLSYLIIHGPVSLAKKFEDPQ